MMVKEYAQELLEDTIRQAKKWGWKDSPEFTTLTRIVESDSISEYASKIGNKKTKAICESIIKKRQNKYARITDKMSASIALDLLSRKSIEEIIDEALPIDAFKEKAKLKEIEAMIEIN